jgi:hypothetical protein
MHNFHGTFRVLLHAANLRHGTDGFTSPPKEGVLRIFSPLKIRQLRPGLNPRTWVLKASTLPLDHRSRLHNTSLHINKLHTTTLHTTTLAPLSYSTASGSLPIPLSAAKRFSRLKLSVCNLSYLSPTVFRIYAGSLNVRRTVPNCPQLKPAIVLSVVPTMFGYKLFLFCNNFKPLFVRRGLSSLFLLCLYDG